MYTHINPVLFWSIYTGWHTKKKPPPESRGVEGAYYEWHACRQVKRSEQLFRVPSCTYIHACWSQICHKLLIFFMDKFGWVWEGRRRAHNVSQVRKTVSQTINRLALLLKTNALNAYVLLNHTWNTQMISTINSMKLIYRVTLIMRLRHYSLCWSSWADQ